jgi:hypothetical protein
MARSGAVLAATVLVLAGVLQAVEGVAAIAGRDFFTAPRHYLFSLPITGWGWIHLVLGALLVLTGLGLFSGAVWAAYAGMTLAVLSAVDNFFFLPYYPLGAIVLIAADLFVLWALAAMLRDRVLTGADAEFAAGAGGPGERWPTASATGTPSRHVTADAPATPTGMPVRPDPPSRTV